MHIALTVRPCTRTWLALVLLTLLNFGIGEAGLGGTSIMVLVLAITLLKSHLVASQFMELRRVARGWRLLMAGYLGLIISMIALAYLLGRA